MEKLIVNIAKTENGFCANLEIIDGFIVAVSGSFSDLKRELAESIEFYIECAKKDADQYPEVLNEEYDFVYKFDIASLLYFYDGIITGTALSKITGIDKRQLSRYRTGASKPRKSQSMKIITALHELGTDLLSVTV
ncbi:MAG: hypothetical protein M0R37_04005 [Bacteroidales bacterium]|nr:hypothetical protein [Bacteroidales bacterium]